MTSEQLAEAVRNFCCQCAASKDLVDLASERVLGVGDAQYTQGDNQTFELIPMGQLIDMLREEVTDVMAYMTMIMLRLPKNTWVSRRFLGFGAALGRLFCIAARIKE